MNEIEMQRPGVGTSQRISGIESRRLYLHYCTMSVTGDER